MQKTGRSISSMWSLGGIRRSLMERLDKVNRALFSRSSNEVDQSNITTEVIGQNSKGKDPEKEITNLKDEPIIPVSKTPSQNRVTERIIPTPKNIINNSVKSNEEKQENGIDVGEIEVDGVGEKISDERDENNSVIDIGDINIDSNEKDKTSQKPNIGVENINVGDPNKQDIKQEKNEDEIEK